MKIVKKDGHYLAFYFPKEIIYLLAMRFFSKLFSAKHLKNESYDSEIVSKYIKDLSNHSIDSKEYEYYAAILDLYYAFEKDCNFCFELKDSFNPLTDKINSLDDLEKNKLEDTPVDVIVLYKNQYYEFQLKRYRGKITLNDLYEFVKRKIVLHYAGKLNYLILLQPIPGSGIDFDIFRKLNEILKKENNQPGYIGFSFNHNNKEIVTVRVLPNLNQYKRKYDRDLDIFSDIWGE